jgi:GNAT superfamily N-acetyltransferase
MITYRRATATDLPAIKQLTDSMLANTKLGLAASNKILNIVNGNNCNVDLAFDDDQCIGFMAGVVHESMFNHVVRASDLGLFVMPGHTGVANELISRFETWANSRGANQVWLGQTTGNRIDITKRFYERKGYTVVGVNCVKEI